MLAGSGSITCGALHLLIVADKAVGSAKGMKAAVVSHEGVFHEGDN
jgi:hypothetical protein